MSPQSDIMALRDRMTRQHARHLWEDSLKPGDAVIVKWGYGLAFRASGLATVVRVNRTSVRVALTHDVHKDGKVGWHAGLAFSVARVHSNAWNEYNSVHPLAPKV